MIAYDDVVASIRKIADLEQELYGVSRQLEIKQLEYEELLQKADAEGITKNDRQRKHFIDVKKKDDTEYQRLETQHEKLKVDLGFNTRMYQLKLKFAGNT